MKEVRSGRAVDMCMVRAKGASAEKDVGKCCYGLFHGRCMKQREHLGAVPAQSLAGCRRGSTFRGVYYLVMSLAVYHTWFYMYSAV
jgi:hypothetical protein